MAKYFADPTNGWAMAEVVVDSTVSNGALCISFRMIETDEVPAAIRDVKFELSRITSQLDLPPLKNPDFMDHVNDLSLLSYLHEPAVFWGIKNRFGAGEIYTYSGMVLIAMNPFQDVDLYSVEIMRDYVGKKRDDLLPHIYGIAEECYKAMLEGTNQSVIVSGESGAGKTQSTKYIMQYLAVVDSLSKFDSIEALQRPESVSNEIRKSETEEAVLASNPILESFGNAKTTRNDNSSRFGKFVELFFSSPSSGAVRITGAKVRTYLLERSRLIFQPATERNYHIFYQLCAAVPAAEKKQLGLDKWESFHYLNQGNAGIVRNINDVEEFKETQNALSTLGMSVSMQWDIFRLCAAILHIGNTQIIDSENDASSISSSDGALEKAAELLGIEKADFVKWVTHKQTGFKEKILKPLNAKAALVARDSVTKVIYTKLFDWLVKAINKNLKRDSTDDQNFIGVLDIYGFEHFAVNSFEQFCINYANEKLQQEFNAHVFRNEQEGYIQEGIIWQMIEFSDNKECIELIEGKPGSRISILSLLDEESRLQNDKADSNFINKLVGSFEKHKYYIKPRFGNTDFTIKHYAVDVTYTSMGFVEKNKDSMSEELQEVLGKSNNAFLREIFADTAVVVEDINISRRSSIVGPRKPTLGSMFKDSLEELMKTIRATEGHYIRCIKPNMAKKAFEFEGAMVLAQLKACGVLETIKISNAGYPNKLGYHDFAARYEVLVKSEFWSMADRKALCQMIVETVLQDSSKYQFGKTKVFLKSGQIAFFEDRRKDRIQHFVSLLAKNCRRFIARRKFLRLREATIILQSTFRGMLARNFVAEQRAMEAAAREKREREIIERNSATKLQSLFRGAVVRKEYIQNCTNVLVLQNAVRANADKKKLKQLKQEAKSVEKVKEKAFSLEAKVLELSQALREKDLASKKLLERCSAYESQLVSWKEKFEALDAKYKAANTEISKLNTTVVNLTAEEENTSNEKDRLALIVSQAAQDGLIPHVSNLPLIVMPPANYSRSPSDGRKTPNAERSRSGGRRPEPERLASINGTSHFPPRIVRSTTINEKSPSNSSAFLVTSMELTSPPRGRSFTEKIPMRFSVSPSGEEPAIQAASTVPFPGLRGPVRIGSVLTKPNEDPAVAALRAEVEILKGQLADCKCSTSRGISIKPKPPVRQPTRVPSMRQKSIFEQDIVDDAEIARKNQLLSMHNRTGLAYSGVTPSSAETVPGVFGPMFTAEPADELEAHIVEVRTPEKHVTNITENISHPKIGRRTTSMLKSPQLNAERERILEREDFNEIVCRTLITNAKAPSTIKSLTPDDVFYPSYLLSSLFGMQIDEGMLVVLHDFVPEVINRISATVVSSEEGAKTAFWISNVYQLLCQTTFLYNREVKKPNNRAVINIIRTIQTDLSGLLETELIPIFLKRLRDQTASLAGPGILENQDLPGMKVESAGGFWGVFGAGNGAESGLLKLKGFLSGVDKILRVYFLPDGLYGKIMLELLRTIGVVCFNGMLVKRNFLNFKRCMQIQYNLTQLEEWCARTGLSTGLYYVEPIMQAAKVLTYNKINFEDVGAVYDTAFRLNASQIYKLFHNYAARDSDSPMTAEFLELLKHRSDATRHRDILTVSLDPEPEYPQLAVTAADGLKVYVPSSLVIPGDFAKLFQ
ncbi:Myosin type-2 heavy chain 1 [Physocladia obscura]|uniref:Myosin type-2 heavy chain 1 n=1 Tax=Physocladia obscura TaxID=109957 RepID=A0AAD5T5X6_9FUNG|nr:Myosin type-2 heavy chain 1 [Physocladia obscura]